jgi:arylsulfatase A-like enzyme
MKYTATLIASLLLPPLAGESAERVVAQPARPNVLMIAIDDMNDWMGALAGHPQVRTPNMDRLAERGMLFTNAHVVAPVCNPSRVGLITGKYPSTTGVYDNSVRWHEAMPGVLSLPQHFKTNGYRVYGGGKIHHHTPGNNRPGDWHEYFDQQFDSHFQAELAAHGRVRNFQWPAGFPLNNIEQVAKLERPPANPREFDWGPHDRDDLEMGDGRMVSWAMDVLRRQHAAPFFLAAGIYMPHLPWYAPRKYFDMYPPDSIIPPPIKDDDLDDLPAGGLRMAADRGGDLELVRRAGQYQQVLQAYLACISYADALVGYLLDALDAGPSATNTIVVLWSDHGWHFGEKEHLHKFTLWERSTRIPYIIAAPGVTQPGTRTRQPASMIDVFPTLNELCQLPQPDGLDGQSIVPLLRDPAFAVARPALTTHGFANHALRTEYWRYIRYADGGEELYDHRTDPHEWYNLADDPAHAADKAALARWLPGADAAPLGRN